MGLLLYYSNIAFQVYQSSLLFKPRQHINKKKKNSTLEDYMNYVKNLHISIKFTVETQNENKELSIWILA